MAGVNAFHCVAAAVTSFVAPHNVLLLAAMARSRVLHGTLDRAFSRKRSLRKNAKRRGVRGHRGPKEE